MIDETVLVGLTMALTEWLKPWIHDRWVPCVPIVMGLALSCAWGSVLGISVIERVLWGLKVAFTGMGLYKVYHTTVKGS